MSNSIKRVGGTSWEAIPDAGRLISPAISDHKVGSQMPQSSPERSAKMPPTRPPKPMLVPQKLGNAAPKLGAPPPKPPSAPPKPPRRSTPHMPMAQMLESQLLTSLECPVCMEYMTPPISLCENGHSVCTDCRARCNDCPTCRRPMLGTRNLALEALARELRYPCRYMDLGCPERKLHPDHISSHARDCTHRPFPCLLTWGPGDNTPGGGCTWSGPVSGIRAHLHTHHPRRFTEFVDPTANAIVWEISQAGCFRDYTHVILAFGEAFVYFKRFNVRDRKLFFAVARAAGSGGDYRYKYKMSRLEDRYKMAVSCSVHSFDDEVESLMLSCACVAVDFDTLAFGKGARRTFCISQKRTKDLSKIVTAVVPKNVEEETEPSTPKTGQLISFI